MPQILDCRYNPPIFGEFGLLTCLWRLDDWEHFVRVVVVDGTLPPTERMKKWDIPVAVIQAMHDQLPG